MQAMPVEPVALLHLTACSVEREREREREREE